MKSILKWFSTPYYFNPSTKFKLKNSLALGFLVFVFLFVFKPFSLSSLDQYLLEYTAGIGLVTFVGSFSVITVLPLLFKEFFNEDTWTVGKNILLIIVSILFVGTLLWAFATYYKLEKGLENVSLFVFLYYTFLVGAIPTLFTILINEKTVRTKRIKRATEISNQKRNILLKNQNKLNNNIIILSENKKEKLSFHIDDLVYISSQGNYASFFIKKQDNEIKENILRVTLTKINSELKNYPNIIRCHKSYIINSKYIIDVKGNARGYLLTSSHIPFEVPVSRSFSKDSLMRLLS